jgi:hypothetical protein
MDGNPAKGTKSKAAARALQNAILIDDSNYPSLSSITVIKDRNDNSCKAHFSAFQPRISKAFVSSERFLVKSCVYSDVMRSFQIF